MAKLDIRKLPNAVLRKKASPISSVSEEDKALLTEMSKIMYFSGGIGLAAPQIGISKQMAVIDIGGGLISMINPSIIKKEGSESLEEGCLSAPDISVNVKRAKRIIVDFINENGEACRLQAEGLLARVIQHELDHLNGKLIVDYMNPIRKLISKRKI